MLSNNVIRFFEVVLEGFLKETNSKIYCQISYFKTLLKNEPVDLGRIEAYVNSLTERKDQFLTTSIVRRYEQHSKSRQKSLKVTLKPSHHDRVKTSVNNIADNCSATFTTLCKTNLMATAGQQSHKELTGRQDSHLTHRYESVSSSPLPISFQQIKANNVDKYNNLKENVQYLANMFSKNTRKLSENDFFEKTRFKKKTVSQSKGSEYGADR